MPVLKPMSKVNTKAQFLGRLATMSGEHPEVIIIKWYFLWVYVWLKSCWALNIFSEWTQSTGNSRAVVPNLHPWLLLLYKGSLGGSFAQPHACTHHVCLIPFLSISARPAPASSCSSRQACGLAESSLVESWLELMASLGDRTHKKHLYWQNHKTIPLAILPFITGSFLCCYYSHYIPNWLIASCYSQGRNYHV